MNNAVRQQPVAADIAITAAKQSRAPKEQATDNDKFMNMLSDAINGKPNQTVKPPEQTEQNASAANSSEQSPTQANPDDAPSALELEDGVAYEQQAVAAAMQMQVMLPIMTEATEEIIAADEPIGIQPMQAVQTEAAAQTETVEAESVQPETAQGTPSHTAKTEQATVERPQTEAAETTVQTRPTETTAPRTARPHSEEEAAPDTRTNQIEPQVRPDTVQRQTIRQRTDETTEDTAVETAESGETDAQIIRQPETPRPMHQMRNHRDPEVAQAKFDGMLARASRELNQNAAVQEAQPIEDAPEDATVAEQPVILETKPQETAKQPELPKTEIKPQEEAKPTEQATVQKSVKAPVTEQRPQQEISQNDEALLGMTQHKQPQIMHEVIRSEPAPQQPQQVQTPDQAEQIKAQVIRNMENERTEFQMQLQPEELGKVNVKMVLEGGKLSVEIAALNPKSVEMLSKQVESLVASLKAGGADVSSVNVVTANENVSAQMNSEYNLNNFQNRERGQGQSGRSNNGTGTAGEQGENAAQSEREPAKTPQRILNYSV